MIEHCQVALQYACLGMLACCALALALLYVKEQLRCVAAFFHGKGQFNTALALVAVGAMVVYGGKKPSPTQMWTVTFDAQGGTVSETSRSVRDNSTIGKLPEPVRSDYSFAGWWTAETDGVQIVADTVVANNMTAYAHWTEDVAPDPVQIDVHLVEGMSMEVVCNELFGFDLKRLVFSDSALKLAVGGLPLGLDYDDNSGKISGTATKLGVYKVTVSATNETVKDPVTTTFEIVVSAGNVFPDLDKDGVMCGVALDLELVDCKAEDGWTVKASGLPSGLKYNAKTSRIIGVPTKAGKFTITFTATKKGEPKQTTMITLTTEPLPLWATGTFAGRVRDGDDYGSATMKVAANGKISGKASLGGTNWTFNATAFSCVEQVERAGGGVATNFVVETTAKAGKATRPLHLEVSAENAPQSLVNGIVSGNFGDGHVGLWRNIWKDKATSASAKDEIAKWVGVYTLSADDGGYLSLTVGKNGDVKASGKLSDGTSISATSPLMYDEDYGWFVLLYASPSVYKGGSLWMPVGLAEPKGALGSAIASPKWTSRNSQATGIYGAGFDREIEFTGAYYDKAKKLSDYHSTLWFSADLPTLNGVEPHNIAKVDFEIDANGKPVIDKASGLTLSFKQATGMFKGGFTFVFDEKTKKKVSFEGVFIQGVEPMRGFYLWGATGSYSDPKTDRPKTYKYKESHSVSLEQ